MDAKLTHVFRGAVYAFLRPTIDKWLDLDAASDNRATLIKPKEVITAWSCQFDMWLCMWVCLLISVILISEKTKIDTNGNENEKITCFQFTHIFGFYHSAFMHANCRWEQSMFHFDLFVDGSFAIFCVLRLVFLDIIQELTERELSNLVDGPK